VSFLDQSDIDSLLSAGGAPGDAAGDAGGGGAGRMGRSRPSAQLPAQFRLAASRNQIQRIMPIRVALTVRLAERVMPMDKVLDINIGTIIEFERHADAELNLMVNNTPIGVGNAVKCGENFGLRVVRIEPWAMRLLEAGLLR
jgi:flagellar motor switch protein FliN/FliY